MRLASWKITQENNQYILTLLSNKANWSENLETGRNTHLVDIRSLLAREATTNVHQLHVLAAHCLGDRDQSFANADAFAEGIQLACRAADVEAEAVQSQTQVHRQLYQSYSFLVWLAAKLHAEIALGVLGVASYADHYSARSRHKKLYAIYAGWSNDGCWTDEVIEATITKRCHGDVSWSHSLGFGIEILDLQQLQFAVCRHLADVHLLGVLDVRWALVWICKYYSVGLHPVLHHLSDLLLFWDIRPRVH